MLHKYYFMISQSTLVFKKYVHVHLYTCISCKVKPKQSDFSRTPVKHSRLFIKAMPARKNSVKPLTTKQRVLCRTAIDIRDLKL